MSILDSSDEDLSKSISPYLKSDDQVLILPFTYRDERIINNDDWKQYYDVNGKYYALLVDWLRYFDIKESNINWLNPFIDSHEKMVNKICNANILLIPGGLPDRFVKRIDDLKLLDFLRSFNGVVIGFSAGAFVQLNEYYLSPDDDYESFGYYDGIGFIDNDFYIEVHYDCESIIQNDSINRARTETNKRVYALTDHGGIIIDDKDIITIGEVYLYE